MNEGSRRCEVKKEGTGKSDDGHEEESHFKCVDLGVHQDGRKEGKKMKSEKNYISLHLLFLLSLT